MPDATDPTPAPAPAHPLAAALAALLAQFVALYGEKIATALMNRLFPQNPPAA